MHIFKYVSFHIAQLVCLVGRLGASKSVIQTISIVVASPTDRPKSVSNSCVMEVFLWHTFVLSRYCLRFSHGIRPFDKGRIQFWIE